MLKRISALLMVMIIMALMVAPVFADDEPVASDINDISVEMDDGKIKLEGFGSGDQSTTWTNIFKNIKHL